MVREERAGRVDRRVDHQVGGTEEKAMVVKANGLVMWGRMTKCCSSDGQEGGMWMAALVMWRVRELVVRKGRRRVRSETSARMLVKRRGEMDARN